MKKIMSKILIILLITILVFEFSCSNISFAASSIDAETINLISNLIGGIVSIVMWLPKLLSTVEVWLFSLIITDNIASADGKVDGTSTLITPYDIFFNHYNILDINVFAQKDEGTIGGAIRVSVAKYFYLMRNIAAIILLIVLLYIGIRMILSTVATDKVKYRKMFFDWACSLALIFVLQYLAIFIIYINNAIVKMIETLITTGDNNLNDAIDRIFTESLVGLGVSGMMAFLVYVMITIQTILFFIAYLNRLLKVAFLVIISPLISITYSIDKIGDGKAQALESWLKEFAYTILIQPFDCIMYLAFANSAMKLLVPAAEGSQTENFLNTLGLNPEVNEIANGVLAILCLKFIKDGEKIIRKIFNFQDDNSSTSVAAGTAIALMAVQRAQKMGSTASKYVGKNSAIGKALQKDNVAGKISQVTDKLKETKAGQFLNSATDKFNNSAIGKGINKIANASKKTIKGYKKIKNKVLKSPVGTLARKTSAAAIAGMGMAMMMSTGAGGLESFGTARRLYDVADSKFYASIDTAGRNVEDSNARLEEAEEKELDEKIQESTEDLREAGIDSEEEMDKTDELEEKAEKAEQEETETRKDFIKNRRENSDEVKDIDNQLLALQTQIAAATVETRPDLERQYEELQTRREEIMNADVTDEELEAMSEDEVISELAFKAARARVISKKANERKSLKHQKEIFHTAEAKMARVSKRSRGVKDSELETQENRILALIAQIEAARRENGIDAEEADINAEAEITDDDMDSAERTTHLLTDSIKHKVLSGGDFDTRDFITKHTGLENIDNPNSMGYYIAREIEKYKRLIDRKNVSENGFGAAKTFGVKEDDFAKNLINRTDEILGSRKKEQLTDGHNV